MCSRIFCLFSVVSLAFALTIAPPGGVSGAVAQGVDFCSSDGNSDKDNNNLPDCLDACVVELLPDRNSATAACPDAFKLEAGVNFESARHRLWYRRFWTGQCIDLNTLLPDFCQNDGFHWADAMTQVLGRVVPTQRNGLIADMWELGELIGQEWSRNKNLRSIDTNMLRHWSALMRRDEDVVATMNLIGQEARAAIRR